MVYTAPPAPVVPSELLDAMDEVIRISDRDHDAWCRAKGAISAYRAAMLNHSGGSTKKAEPVTAAYRLAPEMTIVPRNLTAENGAKALLAGEFTEVKFISCPECLGDDECESCDGSGHLKIEVPVSWTTIKAIWSKAIEHFDPIRLAAAPDEIDKFVDQVCGDKPADHRQ